MLTGLVILHSMTFLFKMDNAPTNSCVHLRILGSVAGRTFMETTLTGQGLMDIQAASALDHLLTIPQEHEMVGSVR